MKDQKEVWKVKKSKLIYSDPWIRLRTDQVIRPNGLESNYSIVELKGGVGVVPLTTDNKIILVGQYRYPPDVYSWEIPKGGFHSFSTSASPLKTAQIELEEETGFTAKEWEDLAMVHTLLGSTNDKVFLFLAKNLNAGKPHPDQTENIKVKKVTFKQFFNMVKSGEITDATSIAAVALAEK